MKGNQMIMNIGSVSVCLAAYIEHQWLSYVAYKYMNDEDCLIWILFHEIGKRNSPC